jgi:hypothetical protein
LGDCIVSSVLIGIIGIALFIGIAVAGAVMLGPKFEDAQINSVSSNVLAAVSTVATAQNNYRFATGDGKGGLTGNLSQLLDGGFLKEVPTNPSAVGTRPDFVDESGVDYANSPNQAEWSPTMVLMSVGDDQELCTAIQRKVGTFSSNQVVSTTASAPSTGANKNSGCFKTSGRSANIPSGSYVAYARL